MTELTRHAVVATGHWILQCSHFGEVVQAAVGGEVHEVRGRLAHGQVRQPLQPAAVARPLPPLRAKCAHRPRQRKHLQRMYRSSHMRAVHWQV